MPGSASELALTPRPSPSLELLALTLEPERVTVDQATYERVLADVTAIRRDNAALADIEHRGMNQKLTMAFDEAASRALRDGRYNAWDCLNAFYGPVTIDNVDSPFFPLTSVSVQFKGNYNTKRIAALYRALPGVDGADLYSDIGDGPTICAWRDVERYEYVVDRAGGDCPSGCTTHEAHLFASDSPGEVSPLEVWRLGEASNEPWPEWFSRICR